MIILLSLQQKYVKLASTLEQVVFRHTFCLRTQHVKNTVSLRGYFHNTQPSYGQIAGSFSVLSRTSMH